MVNSLKSMLKEPLLHFLLLGAVIFVVYSLISRNEGSGELGEVGVVTRASSNIFAVTFARPGNAAALGPRN